MDAMHEGLDSFFVISPSEGGFDLDCRHRVDPLRVDASPFLDLIQRLDELVKGPVDRVLPRWAFYDCAELPGAVAGFARQARDLPDHTRMLMKVAPRYQGPVPLSQAAVIPMVEPGSWHVYAVASLDRVDAGLAPPDLAAATIVMALRGLGATTGYAAVPWGSPVLAALAPLAPLELLTAWTPAHSEPATMTCRFAVAAEPGRETSPPATMWIAPDDHDGQRRLQSGLESGGRYEVVGSPGPDGVGLHEVSSP